jgi:hypothetical protein
VFVGRESFPLWCEKEGQGWKGKKSHEAKILPILNFQVFPYFMERTFYQSIETNCKTLILQTKYRILEDINHTELTNKLMLNYIFSVARDFVGNRRK